MIKVLVLNKEGNGFIAPHILDLDTRWAWFVIFTLLPFYSQLNSPLSPQVSLVRFRSVAWASSKVGQEDVE
jgi:hypothetical protein